MAEHQMDAEAMHRPLSSVFSSQMVCRGADTKAQRRRLTFLRKYGSPLLDPYQSGAFILTEIYSGLTRLPQYYCASIHDHYFHHATTALWHREPRSRRPHTAIPFALGGDRRK